MDIHSIKWAKRFLTLAHEISTWSKDDSTKVGCFIVDDEGHPISHGFNGMPKGIDDTVYTRLERPEKYLWFEHAERNAIYLTNNSLKGCTMFITHAPCADCARGIIQTGITSVVIDGEGAFSSPLAIRFGESMVISQKMLIEAGVRLYQLDMEKGNCLKHIL